MSFWIKKYNIELEALPISLLSKSIFVVFLCIAILSCILLLLPIQDKIKGDVRIFTKGQPLALNAPSSGFLHLINKDNAEVDRGDLLATIDVEINQESLDAMDQLIHEDLLNLDVKNTSELHKKITALTKEDFRDINSELLALLDKLKQLELVRKTSDPRRLVDTYNRGIQLKSEQVKKFEKLNLSSKRIISLLKEQYEADSMLVSIGGLAERELSETQKTYIERASELIENDLRKQKLEGEIVEDEKELNLLILASDTRIQELSMSVYDHVTKIRQKYQEYKKLYLVQSPMTGTVRFQYDVVDQEMVNERDAIMYLTMVSTENSTRSEMYIGANNAGKVQPGMKVRVGLSEFDQKEFGIYYTTISDISEVQQDGSYKINLDCTLPLTTSYDARLPIRDTYSGKGEVLLGKINLLTKIAREIHFNKAKYASL